MHQMRLIILFPNVILKNNIFNSYLLMKFLIGPEQVLLLLHPL